MNRDDIIATLIEWVDETYGGLICNENDAEAFADRLAAATGTELR